MSEEYKQLKEFLGEKIDDLKKSNREEHGYIIERVDKTNGRVKKLELWRSMLIGGFIAISLTIGIPQAISYIFPKSTKAEMSEEDIKELITNTINKELNEYVED